MKSAATNGWRLASLVLGAMSLLLPVTALVSLRTDLFQPDGEFCGMSTLGVLLLVYLLCFVLSAIAVTAGAVGYWHHPIPRPRWRRFELGLVALPGLAMLGIALAVVILE